MGAPIEDVEQLRRACGRVEVTSPEPRVGTAYLLAPDLAATAAHVVAGAAAIAVRFGTHAVTGVPTHTEAGADWALLQLSPRVEGVQPLVAGGAPRPFAPWVSFGFPAAADGAGFFAAGNLLGAVRAKDGSEELQLYSEEAAAGRGGLLQGMSGAPVVQGGAVVGHLKRVLPDADGAAQLGTIYACPIASFHERVPATPAPQRKPQGPGTAFDPTWYVPRPALERPLVSHLASPGGWCCVWGPRSFGKSWLVETVLKTREQQARLEGRTTRRVTLDLRQVKPDDWASWRALTRALLVQLLEQLGGDDSWITEAEASPREPFVAFLLRRVVAGADEVLLTVDGGEKLGQSEHAPSAQNLPPVLRACWTAASRGEDHPFRRLRVVFVSSQRGATMEGLPEASALFSLLLQVTLDPFSSAEARALGSLYTPLWPEEVVASVLGAVGGHPYWLRTVFHLAVSRAVSPVELLANGSLMLDLLNEVSARLDDRERGLLGMLARDPAVVVSDGDFASLRDEGLLVEDAERRRRFAGALIQAYFARNA